MNSWNYPAFDQFTNNGGCFDTFFFAEADACTSFDEFVPVISTELITQINMRSGYASPDSLKLEVTEVKGDGGIKYQNKIQGFYPRISAAMNSIMHQMSTKKFVAIAVDRNGLQHLLGSPDLPLSFSFDMKTGSTNQDRNGYSFEFSCETTSYPPIYDVEIAASSGNSTGGTNSTHAPFPIESY